MSNKLELLEYSNPYLLPVPLVKNKRVITIFSKLEGDIAYISNSLKNEKEVEYAHLLKSSKKLLAACKDALESLEDIIKWLKGAEMCDCSDLGSLPQYDKSDLKMLKDAIVEAENNEKEVVDK